MNHTEKSAPGKSTKQWKASFFPFWISQSLSLLGSSLVQFAFVWWLTEETGSARVLALASMAALLPEMVMQPFAGAIVDRNDRKLFIILNDAIIALATLVVGLLFFFGRIAVWHIYIMMAVRAVASAFHYPASQATVALMVPPEHLTRISGLNQAMQGIVRIIAPALGALILSIAGVEGAVLIDVITALMAIGIVFFLVIPKQPQLNKKDGHWFKIILSDMHEGFQYLVRWKGLMGLTAMALIVKIALTPAFSLVSLLVQNHFGGGAAEFSRIEMSIGIGVIAGSLLLGIWGGFRKRMVTIICGIAGVGVGMLLLGVLPSHQFLSALAAALLLGFMIPIVDAPLMAILQAKVHNEFQGRVLTMFGTLIYLSSPIGLAIAGPLADRFGVQMWYVIAGFLCFLVLGFGSLSATIRNLEDEKIHHPFD